jgi:non-haem dioxygenase in morphine synthesis N-terminal
MSKWRMGLGHNGFMAGSSGSAALPVIDVSPLVGGAATAAVAEQIQLADASTEFFALPTGAKLEIAMEHGGRAWRGYFPVGAELTSGRPDLKEGLYFGAELPGDDPRVLAGLPLHGSNLFPRQVPRLGPPAEGDDGRQRWDGQDLRAFTGSYGDYLLGKVSKVFPQLRSDVLG